MAPPVRPDSSVTVALSVSFWMGCEKATKRLSLARSMLCRGSFATAFFAASVMLAKLRLERFVAIRLKPLPVGGTSGSMVSASLRGAGRWMSCELPYTISAEASIFFA